MLIFTTKVKSVCVCVRVCVHTHIYIYPECIEAELRL